MRTKGSAASLDGGRPIARTLAPGESSRRIGLALLAVALTAYFGLAFENFFTLSNGISIMLNVSAILIAGVGAAFLLISGNVDLSIGGQYALISVVTALVARDTGSAVLAVLAAILCGLVLGLANGLLVRWMKISPLIVTLGTMAIFKGAAYVVSGGNSVFGFPEAFIVIGRLRIAGVPLPVIVALAIFLVASFWLIRSAGGLRLFAIGGNKNAAMLTGVRVDRTVVALYAFNGLLMGVVALLTTSRLGSGTPQLGLQFELNVLTAVILGGVGFAGGSGHPIGVFVGVATIGILSSGMIFAGLADWWQEISRGGVLLLALAADQVATHRRERSMGHGPPPDPPDPTSAVAPTGGADEEYGGIERDGELGDVVLDCRDLSRRFGSVSALKNGSLSVRRGEVVCLLGDNGAGKSTLIKLLSGVYKPDGGSISFEGDEVEFDAPIDARRIGIETVHQDLAVCPNLGVAHNLVLGDEPKRRLLGLLPVRDDRAAVERAKERLARLGIEIADLGRSIARLSGGQRQSVAIARAMKPGVSLAILDEPTAALGVTQTRNVLKLVRQVANTGAGVVLITHDIRSVLAVADRVVVLRLGEVVFEGDVADVSHSSLLHLMAGLESSPVNTASMKESPVGSEA